MQEQHNNNSWEDSWYSQTLIDITNEQDLDDIPYNTDDIPYNTDDISYCDDPRTQSALSFPQSVMTDGDNITEPPTPADSFRPITPSSVKNPCQTPTTESNSTLNIDFLDDLDSQTFDNNYYSKCLGGCDTKGDYDQPMSDESYDAEYSYRNGPTSCSSVNHHDSEIHERGKRKSVHLEDKEIVHAGKRRRTKSSYQSTLRDTHNFLNEVSMSDASHQTRTIPVCPGSSLKQTALEASQRHSSLPNASHPQTIVMTPLYALGTLFSDVNGNIYAQKQVTASNNDRPHSQFLPPVSPFPGTSSPIPPGPIEPSPYVTIHTSLAFNEGESLPSSSVDSSITGLQKYQTINDAVCDLDAISRNTRILHSDIFYSNYSGHWSEALTHDLQLLPQQSPYGSSVSDHENNSSSNTIYSHCLPLISSSLSDLLPNGDVSEIGLASLVGSEVIDNQCPIESIANKMENVMSHISPVPRMAGKNLLTSSNESGHHQITSVPSPGPSNLHQTVDPTFGPPYLQQTSVPSPGQFYPVTTNGPNCVTSKFAQNDTSLTEQLLTDNIDPQIDNIDPHIDNIDPYLAETYQNACKTKSTKELTKYILKTKILLRKNQTGKTDTETNFDKQIKYEMTPEELEKSQQRKELNRLAAAKHRNTKKQQREKTEQEYQVEMERKQMLEVAERQKLDKKDKLISDLLKLGLTKEKIQQALQ